VHAVRLPRGGTGQRQSGDPGRRGGRPGYHRLAEGVASATLRVVDAGAFPPSKCDQVATTWLQIIPPNQYAALYLPYKSTGCSDSATHLLTITVVVPGNGG